MGNPSKQQQLTLKRTIDNNESDEAIPKRINIETPTEEEMMIDDILQSPGWPDDSTETSQTEEQIMETSQNEGQTMDLQNLLGIMTPITPIKTRSRSQEQERLTINTKRIKNNQDKNRSRSQEQKRQTKNTTEKANNKDKIHQTAIHRINKTAHKGKNQKPKINNKPRENKEQKPINNNILNNKMACSIEAYRLRIGIHNLKTTKSTNNDTTYTCIHHPKHYIQDFQTTKQRTTHKERKPYNQTPPME